MRIIKNKYIIALLIFFMYLSLLLFIPLLGKKRESKIIQNYKSITYIEQLDDDSIKSVCTIGNYDVISKWNKDKFRKISKLNINMIVSINEHDSISEIDDSIIKGYYISDYSTLSNCKMMIDSIKKKRKKDIFVKCRNTVDYEEIKKVADYIIVDDNERINYNYNDYKIIVLCQGSINNWHKRYLDFLKEKKTNKSRWGFIIKLEDDE